MKSLIVTTVLLGLSWFAATNLAASAVAWLAAAVVRRRQVRPSAGLLLAIRLFPAVASLFITLALFVPAHWMTEARDTNESIGFLLRLFAVLGALLILRGAARATALGRADRRLRAGERASSLVPGATESPDVRGLALAGLLHPRIVLDAEVASALTRGELAVALAHEQAHRRAFDNLKRAAFYCAPDFFGASRMAAHLEHAWHAAAEALADARAAAGNQQRAVDLASALVKVARLTIELPTRSPVWSTFNDPVLLTERVHELTSGAPAAPRYHPGRTFSAGLAVIAAAAMLVPVLSGAIHAITEAAVALLP